MSKVSRWKQILYLIQRRSKGKFKRNQFWGKSHWLFILGAVVVMFLWNWMLVLATVAGVGSMLLVYLMPGWNWQSHWSNWQRFLTGYNRKLTLAVSSGGVAAFASYLAARIWVDTENRWLATGIILQFLATMITLGIVLWHIVTHQATRPEVKYYELLPNLTDVDPLKRLIAVRQLTYLVNKTPVSKNWRGSLLEYFRLMLSVEQEPIIREAVIDSLQMWGEIKSDRVGGQSLRPLQMPLNFPRTSHRLQQ